MEKPARMPLVLLLPCLSACLAAACTTERVPAVPSTTERVPAVPSTAEQQQEALGPRQPFQEARKRRSVGRRSNCEMICGTAQEYRRRIADKQRRLEQMIIAIKRRSVGSMPLTVEMMNEKLQECRRCFAERMITARKRRSVGRGPICESVFGARHEHRPRTADEQRPVDRTITTRTSRGGGGRPLRELICEALQEQLRRNSDERLIRMIGTRKRRNVGRGLLTEEMMNEIQKEYRRRIAVEQRPVDRMITTRKRRSVGDGSLLELIWEALQEHLRRNSDEPRIRMIGTRKRRSEGDRSLLEMALEVLKLEEQRRRNAEEYRRLERMMMSWA